MHARIGYRAGQFVYGHRMMVCQGGQRMDLACGQVGHGHILHPGTAAGPARDWPGFMRMRWESLPDWLPLSV
jgi:hypothetical protein